MLWLHFRRRRMLKLDGDHPGDHQRSRMTSSAGTSMGLRRSPVGRSGLVVGFAVLSTLLLEAGTALAAQLTQWSFDPTTRRLELIVPGGTSPQYFLLAQPPRIVVDLPNTEMGNVIETGTYSGTVRSVRVGQFQPELTRIVIELAPDAVFAPGHIDIRSPNSPALSSSAANPGYAETWYIRPLLVGDTPPAAMASPVMSPEPDDRGGDEDAISPSASGPPPLSETATSMGDAGTEPGADIRDEDISNDVGEGESGADDPAIAPPEGLPPLEPGALEIPIELMEQPTAPGNTDAAETAIAPATPPTPPLTTDDGEMDGDGMDNPSAIVANNADNRVSGDVVEDDRGDTVNTAPGNTEDSGSGVSPEESVADPDAVDSDAISTDAVDTDSISTDALDTNAVAPEAVESEPPTMTGLDRPDSTVADAAPFGDLPEAGGDRPLRSSPTPPPFPTPLPGTSFPSEPPLTSSLPPVTDAALSEGSDSNPEIPVIDFGEQLPSAPPPGGTVADTPDNTSTAMAVPASDAILVSVDSQTLIPAGTILTLRYPRDVRFVLAGNRARQEVLLTDKAVRDRAGTVLIPAGSLIIGRFEAVNGDELRFVAQALNLGDRTVSLEDTVTTIASGSIEPNQLIEIEVGDRVSR